MSSSWSVEIETAVPAPRLFKAAVVDKHNRAPKVAPQKIVSTVLVNGDGSSVGSIRQFNFPPGPPFKFEKERLDFVDVENCEARSTLVKDGTLGIRDEVGSTHIKVESKARGSVVKVNGTYKALPGVNAAAEINNAKATFTSVIKGCEAYLVANPRAYN